MPLRCPEEEALVLPHSRAVCVPTLITDKTLHPLAAFVRQSCAERDRIGL